ncbi:mannose-1-phosphate guanylyltransferase [Nocardioides pocheonensis]|uniref:Mannose-1-phosphate guanylyltransferase n=1 Tax=Nocardioides pocheonensis TaxID=661485 RepID=A0A3N0GNA3_9ACTN|nr:mannose-1-phosphate guanylyltransferase [Nocardioides pocheonensis]RNM13580.1 mannose-1-phosphate guanylyltransferase [Nocardioides pocheonensis]
MTETSSASSADGQLWAVVPAGGAGTRLWPLSRAGSPKFLHDLTGSGRTLLQATLDRLEPLVGERVLVVTGVAHQDAVRRQLHALPGDRVVAEPSPRDSMAAIGLAAAMVERTDPDALIGSFAADHVIADPEAFRACVEEAAEVARTGLLVTIGIEPARPSTGFGYIHLGERLPGFPTACAVEEFVEKPDSARARAYVDSGEYRWNAGMFVARAGVLLDLLAVEHPDLASGLRAIAADPSRLEEIWPGLTKIAIDHAVAEPAAAAGKVAVVPGGFGWEDIGDFAALADLLPDAAPGLKVLGDADVVLASGSTGLVVPGSGRTVAVLGLDDVVVVDTGDALLVTTTAHAQDVKSIVEALKSSGRSALT